MITLISLGLKIIEGIKNKELYKCLPGITNIENGLFVVYDILI